MSVVPVSQNRSSIFNFIVEIWPLKAEVLGYSAFQKPPGPSLTHTHHSHSKEKRALAAVAVIVIRSVIVCTLNMVNSLPRWDWERRYLVAHS